MKQWFKVITPREDLRSGKPLDASEFAIHLDQVRDGRAPIDYQDPKRFFERTYLTDSLFDLSCQVVRRLAGEKVETSAIFNLSTQFGGGKTHALTLLYHLATTGYTAINFKGVNEILLRSSIKSIPTASIATFVGTEFDSITGRGGNDGTPLRRTPWGEIAYQLGGIDAFKVVEAHELNLTAPGGDVIRKMLPKDKPCLILIDELMNYVSRSRKSGLSDQLYDFLQNLSEVVRSEDKIVLVVSIPASVLEMTETDHADYERIKKMLNRLGKAMVMSASSETSEIIRRRLFEWDGLPSDAKKVISEYSRWIQDHNQQLSNVLGKDNIQKTFEDTYPFHPAVISVFDKKWRTLPRFQQTRGILRLLALWVSKVYQDAYRGKGSDPLIDLGSAPLEDPLFRAALFEQLGDLQQLEGVVTTDICGKKDSIAVRLDKEASDPIKKMKLHQRIATSILFESNGGMTKMEATVPEIRLDISRPDLDIGNVDTVLDNLGTSCYYLTVQGTRYHFSMKENLNKRFADRCASIRDETIDERLKDEIRIVFNNGISIERVFFPLRSNQISDRPSITLIIMDPARSLREKETLNFAENISTECGALTRVYKNAIIFAVADNFSQIKEETRKLLAWEDIYNEKETLHIDDVQKSQLQNSYTKAKRDVREAVWRNYNALLLMGKDGKLKTISLGLPHSSAANSFLSYIVTKLVQDGEVQESIGVNFLLRNWPPAIEEWSTKSLRDMFFSSSLYPRLLYPDRITDTIIKGISAGQIAYVGKTTDGKYDPAYFQIDVHPDAIEISDDVFIVKAERFKANQEPPKLTRITVLPSKTIACPHEVIQFQAAGFDQKNRPLPLDDIIWEYQGGEEISPGILRAGDKSGQFNVVVRSGEVFGSTIYSISTDVPPTGPTKTGRLTWNGQIPDKQWAIFYTKVLSKFSNENDLKISLTVEVIAKNENGIPKQTIGEAKIALRELNLSDAIQEN